MVPEPQNLTDQPEAKRLITDAYDGPAYDGPTSYRDRSTDAYNRPAVRPDIAELLARHKDEADHYRTEPYVPQPRPEVKPSEPMPGWAKGIALVAPTTGGGVWLAMEGVSGVMNAVSPEVVAAIGAGGLFVFLVALAGRKKGPKKVVTNYDMRGSTISSRRSSGITYKSNN